MKRLIFIGGVGASNDFGGELTKNKYLINALNKKAINVLVVDTHGMRKRPWRVIKLFMVLLFHPKCNIVISTSLGNVYWLIKLFYYLKTKRKITYFGIGGCFSKLTLDGLFDKKYLSVFNIIIVEGNKMKKELEICGLDSVVVPNFKKIDYIPDLTINRKPSDNTRFVFLSRLHPEKGVDLILDCVSELNSNGFCGRFVVDFYGGFESEEYKQIVESRLRVLPNTKYQGKLDLMSHEGFNILSSYDVMLFPTYWNGEGFPGVVIDSYIAGLPLIASDWNFNAEFIDDGVTGVIIPSKDKDALCEAMRKVIVDKSRIIEMSGMCQKKALLFDVDNVVTDELIEMICN